MNKIEEMIDEFLSGPLATWFASCLEMVTDEKLTYESLVNGYLIHNVFLQMNLQVHEEVYLSKINSASWRSSNLKAVLNNIRRFYEDSLEQVILRLPDVENLGREPEHHVREAELLLVLLLGCAVQCPKKEKFIDRITRLDEECQLIVAEWISQVIEHPGLILSSEMFSNLDNTQKAIECVRKICNERDEYKTQLRHRRELEDEQLGDDLCEKLQLELKVRSLEEQLQQKYDELDDAKDEIKERDEILREMKESYEKLEFEAKNVNYYKDELDAATESIEKVEKLEQEIDRYQKKLIDFDSCRTRLKELEKSNKDLKNSKAELLKQINSQKAEREKIRDLKKQVTKLTEQISNLTVENVENRDKYWTVCKERTELQRLVKASYKQRTDGESNTQLVKLQADNKSLVEKLEKTLSESSSKISTLTQDNKKLLQKIDSLKENYNREVIKSKDLAYICKAALNEARKMKQKDMDHLKSLLEKAENKCSGSVLKNLSNDANVSKDSIYDVVPKSFNNPNKSVQIASMETKCNVVRSRKLLKYVKTQS